jgi:uncharacterized protein (TIGR02118 family)
MIHVLYFITRKPDMDEAKFHRYWREVHAPIVVKIPQLRRYVQSHRIDTTRTNSAYDDNVSTYDGVAEVHLDGLDAFAALLKTREYLEGALADEQNFLDLTRVEWMATRYRGCVVTSSRTWLTRPIHTPSPATMGWRSCGSTARRRWPRRSIRQRARMCKRTGRRWSTCVCCASSSPRRTL